MRATGWRNARPPNLAPTAPEDGDKRSWLEHEAGRADAVLTLVVDGSPRRRSSRGGRSPIPAPCGRTASCGNGISAKVLTETLRDLERHGLVARHVYAEVPPRVEYELAPRGHTPHASLQALGHGAERHFTEVLAARESCDARQRGRALCRVMQR
ncbi:winged helix-turn-helix transcriptional regulator [Streptomyces hawaiiensis]|uniref:HTH hxlR-type domain-containing protein n=1 Tax=Streptomyces hawaiiensis TaxID=67305 RepID=A0A6G5RMZ0_9ACTN|nr:hypothetical protein CEB94_33175 [Streptomyces hawaiiensis]